MFVEQCICVVSTILLLVSKTECSTSMFINDSVLIEHKEFNITCTALETSIYSTWIVGNSTFLVSVYSNNGSCFTQRAPQSVKRCYRPDDKTYIVAIFPRRNQQGENWTCSINGQNSISITLIIAVPVTNVTITPESDSKIVLKENVNTEVKCVTSYSRPMANIAWYINSKSASTPINGSTCSNDTNDEELVSTKCAIQLNLSRNYNDGYLVCTAENINDYEVVSGNKSLNITYKMNQPLIHCTKNGLHKVVMNTQGKLTCSVDGGNPAATLRWNCTDDVTEQHGDQNNVTQTIVWNANQTKYCACIAKNYAGTRSATAMSELLYVPVIDELQNKSVFEGDTITLKCIILRANPSVSAISWTSNGHNISESTLFIPNVSRNDDTMYTCTANNTMEPSCKDGVQGSTSRSLHIGVLYPPLVNIPYGTQFTFREGDVVNYTCPTEPGNPAATIITWRRSTDTSTWNSSTLLIHAITRYDDSVYTCYASNVMVNSNNKTRISNVSADIRLIVQFKTNVTDFYIRGHRNRSSVIVNENTSLVFECHIHSNPTSDVRLYEAGGLVNSSRANNLLYYTSATCSGGPVNYSCQGNNTISNHPSVRKIQVVVNCTPRRVMDVDELVAAGAINDTVTLSYIALAYPLPSFTWYRNGSAIYTTDTRAEVSSTDFQTNLTIYHLIESDFGEYTVTVDNGIGLINESFNLRPQGVPEVPTNLRQDNTSTTISTIALYWTSGFNNGLEQTFSIMHRKSSGYIWKNDSVPDKGRTGTTQYHNISGLSSDTNYDIVLFTVNAIGPSKDNVTLLCRTKKASDMSHSEESSGVLIGAIVGSIAASILFGVSLLGVIIIRRRVKNKQPSNELSTGNPATPVTVYENVTNDNRKQELSPLVASGDRDVYENAELGKSSSKVSNGETSIQHGEYVNFSKKARTEKLLTTHEELPMRTVLPDVKSTTNRPTYSDAPPPVPAKADYAGLLCKVDDDDGHVNNNVTDENVYNNSTFKIERIEAVFVHELFDFVAEKSFESFATEFNILPKGLTMPYTVAVKPENIKLNRYNGIFPYDHSRVTIPDDPDFFTNACYMDGYKKEKCYIASLGPTSDTSKKYETFWRMVWHEQSDIIVMVTNLREITGMKCEEYWPKLGTSIAYGGFTVTSRNVEEYAEYTVRTFIVSYDINCRSVTQLHFTAWPDKGVPGDLTSLLEFRQRINSTSSMKLGPVIVHCSAGIGRTGTYIALDRLILEGKATNSINVSTCVRSMRQQRVSMVQTQEQYMYIYKACVYALAFKCDHILAETFHDQFKSTTDAQLAELFKKLKTVVDNDKKEEKEAILNNKHEKSNRANADIEGDRHRVRLYVDKESEESDYTNAIYINSFKTKNKFIAAQSTLREFVQDFICTVFQEQCICVIDMDGSTPSKLDVGAYLPTANVSGTFGNFTISCDKLESNPKYTVTKIKIENTGKIYKGDWTSYHFKYHDWKHGKETPGNAHDFVDLWKEVNEYANQFGDKESHILIHCLDGSTRSGLFCFVACLLEKVQCERLVNVGNTLRQVRTRRKTTVKNANQLKFCFKAVDAFIETNKAK